MADNYVDKTSIKLRCQNFGRRRWYNVILTVGPTQKNRQCANVVPRYCGDGDCANHNLRWPNVVDVQ